MPWAGAGIPHGAARRGEKSARLWSTCNSRRSVAPHRTPAPDPCCVLRRMPTEDPTTQMLLAVAPHTPKKLFVVPPFWAAQAIPFHFRIHSFRTVENCRETGNMLARRLRSAPRRRWEYDGLRSGLALCRAPETGTRRLSHGTRCARHGLLVCRRGWGTCRNESLLRVVGGSRLVLTLSCQMVVSLRWLRVAG